MNQTIDDVVAYYESKTNSILQRYGPGPRVHYHTGLVDDQTPSNLSKQELRRRLVLAQERTLYHAAEVWDASSTLRGDIVDIGCGLGGGAIFWAQEFGARVTAVTCVPSHVKWVVQFAAQAGVASRVSPLACDALAIPGEDCFDAAVAVDSSCHLPRKDLFSRLCSLLRPGGRVFIADCFLGRTEYEEGFNRYWHTRIGTIDEYLAAARKCGLRDELIEDVSCRTAQFWTTTLALIRAEAGEVKPCHADAARFELSLRAHSTLARGLADRGLKYALMSFLKPGA